MSKHDLTQFKRPEDASSDTAPRTLRPLTEDEAALQRIREDQERQEVTGGCMCGAVRYAARLRGRGCSVYHCRFCRAWSGGPFFSVRSSWFVLIEGEEAEGFVRSSAWRERAFCKNCGTHLTYRLVSPDAQELKGNCLISLGSLDEPEDLPLRAELYCDSRPASCPALGAAVQVDRATMNARRDAVLKTYSA